MTLIFQYIVVGLILVAVAAYVVRKLISLRRQVKKGEPPACCGCSLSDSCNKKKNLKEKNKETECHENNKDMEQ